MMGAAMLNHHRFVRSLWALYRLVVSSITFVCHLYVGESGAALVKHKIYWSGGLLEHSKVCDWLLLGAAILLNMHNLLF